MVDSKFNGLGVLSAVLFLLGGIVGGDVFAAAPTGGVVWDTSGVFVEYASAPDLDSLVKVLAGKLGADDITVDESWVLGDNAGDTVFVVDSIYPGVVKNSAGSAFILKVKTSVKATFEDDVDTLTVMSRIPIRVAKTNAALYHLDTAAFRAWLRQNTFGEPIERGDSTVSHYRFATGQPVGYSAAIGLKSGLNLSGLGTSSLSYVGFGGTTYNSATAPTDTGTYKVSVAYGGTGNTNFNDNAVHLGILRVDYAEYAANLFLAENQRVTYRHNASASPYVISGPTVLPGIAGVIDSIFYTAVGADGGLNTAVFTAKPNHGSGKSGLCSLFVAGVNDTGSIHVTAKVKGKTAAAGGNVFLSKDIKYTITVDRRSIDSVKVFSVETYKGDIIKPTTFFVYSGGTTLIEDTDFAVVKDTGAQKEYNMVNAGPASMVVTGTGKYTGRKNGDYTIHKKKIYVSANVVGTRYYDGTTAIEVDTLKTPRLKLWFDTTASRVDEQLADKEMFYLVVNAKEGKTDTLKWGRDYTATAAYNDAAAGIRSMTATVTLVENGAKSKNYTFTANGANVLAATVSKGGLDILKRTPKDGGDTAVFVFDIPDTADAYPPTAHYANGQARGIETATDKVSFKSGLAGGPVTVLYGYPAGSKPYWDTTFTALPRDTTIAPRDAGVYTVKARIPDGENFTGGTYALGDYRIKAPAVAKFAADGDLADAEFREGNSITLTVKASSPNGPAGALSYKWYRYTSPTDSVLIADANGASYTVSAGVEGDVLEYAVKITNNPGAAVQTAADVMSARSRVTVKKAAASMSKAIIAINPDKAWIYKGDSIKPTGADVVVWLPVTLADGSHDTVEIGSQYYTLSYVNNVNAGTATIRASGVDATGAADAYSGTVSKTFAILPKTLERSDLTYTASRAYSGDTALGADVKTAQPKSGMGAITTFYDGSATVPVDVGEYDVTVTVAAGTNFTAGEVPIGTYRITRKTPDTSSVAYGGIPTDHKQGDSATVYGVGEVKLKGTGYESVTVYYGADTVVPNTAGSYTVKIVVAGGENYTDGEVTLGVYNIGAAPVSVAGANREIPAAPAVREASVAPVKAAAPLFTAGPSPVSRNAGKIAFFSAMPVKGGSLYVFDAAGNAVAKLTAKPGSGEIGGWNLKDKNGATVTEGPYVVKGTLTGKDGTREKVSFLFSVVK
ncbi:MAG: hypothetical protein LBB74_03980 [Chitinispirillales bacterium]|jgi:hypothetical protein|nr:hypothetical protein [Chitinispirillales bacterium]